MSYEQGLSIKSSVELIEDLSICRHNINSFYQLIQWNGSRKDRLIIKEMNKWVSEMYEIKYLLRNRS